MAPPTDSFIFGWRLSGTQLSTGIYGQNRQGIGIIRFDTVNDDVGHSGNDKFAGSGKCGFVADMEMVGEKLSYRPNAQRNATTRGWTFLGEVSGYCCGELARSASSVSQPHRSKRRQNSSISSSVA